MTTRMPGITGAFDTQSMVTATLEPYKLKITNTIKQRDLLKVTQTQYRDVINKTKDFYDKYLKIGSGGLLQSSNYQSLTFTSSDAGKVTATAGSAAILDNYKVSVSKVAKAATATIEKSEFLDADGKLIAGKSLIVNGKSITLEGGTTKEIVDNLNGKLTGYNIGVKAKYTDFASTAAGTNVSALVLEATALGKDNTFSVGVSYADATTATSVTGTAATGAKATFTFADLTAATSKKITIDGAEMEFTNTDTAEDIAKKISQTIDSLNLDMSVNLSGNDFTLETKATGLGSNITLSIGDGASTTSYGTSGTKTESDFDLNEIGINSTEREIMVNGKVIRFDTSDNDKNKMLAEINKQVESLGLEAEGVLDGSGNWSTDDIRLISKTVGANEIKVSIGTASGSGIAATMKEGQDANVTITNSTGGVYSYTGTSNTVTLDGVKFAINESTYDATGTIDTPITLSGKKDATALKAKIVSFVKDYNELITNLNTKLSEKRDKSYMPLSSEERSAMSESDIKLWEEKVSTGVIRKDTDVQRIVNSMKSAMRTMVSGSGTKLESIGIEPVNDFQTSNGTFIIDEDKLTTALENNMDDVKDLFLKESTNNGVYEDGGIITNIKSILDKEIITYSTSALVKKAGYTGSVSDEISLQLTKMQTKIDDMNTALATREQSLYSKYATLESAMSKLQSQQKALASQLSS